MASLRYFRFELVFFLVVGLSAQTSPMGPISVDTVDFRGGDQIALQVEPEAVILQWRVSADEHAVARFNLVPRRPALDHLAVRRPGADARPIIESITPYFLLHIGQRNLASPESWSTFFDNPAARPHYIAPLVLEKKRISVAGDDARATVTIDEVSGGGFRGRLEFTVYRGSPLVFTEAVIQTEENGRAFLFDAGLVTPTIFYSPAGEVHAPEWSHVAWQDPAGALRRSSLEANTYATGTGGLPVANRTIVAEGRAGAVALFPPPHQFFYPLNAATNLALGWFGNVTREFGGNGMAIALRNPSLGDRTWVPWFNAPPRSQQRLGLFLYLSDGDAGAAIAGVKRFTRDDRFPTLPGYKTFTSHYHIEHTLQLTRARQRLGDPTAIPADLRQPDFVRTFRGLGVDIVHLAEFHFPVRQLPAEKRLPLLRLMYDECARLSDDSFLVLPGEEPNVHLGGHWLSLFPKPVYWVLNRPATTPFAQEVTGYGTVYHVGSAAEVLELMQREGGLMWTAHPRIKASVGFPDAYWDQPFYRSDRFLGGAWKAMPADLSQPRLGARVLDLQDAMANRGDRKYILGEADLFQIDPSMEVYGHLNVNYLRLERLPRYADGWQPVLDALGQGDYFVTTGEVVLPEFTVDGARSGQQRTHTPNALSEVKATVEWTFPLAFAEIVSGDGTTVHRQRISLTDTEAFGRQSWTWPADLRGRTWARLEVWDVARNGAFTPPVWLAPAPP